MINRSVNTLEEAVKVVMEELGWDLILDEYHLEYKVGDEYDSEILSKEQALAHCKDLNVLELVVTKLGGELTIGSDYASASVSGYEAINEVDGMIKDNHEAALYSVADAIKHLRKR